MEQDPTPYSRIYEYSYYMIGTEENRKMSRVIISNKETTKNDLPVPNGVCDSHMGTTEMSWSCTTCGNTKRDCPGHFGSIDLKYPIKNPMFREQILKWLKIICFYCGEIITDEYIHNSSRANLLAEYGKKCRSVSECAHCKKTKVNVNRDNEEYSIINIETTDLHGNVEPTELFNHEIYAIFERITDETLARVGKPIYSHPKKLILYTINVPPNTIRPDIRRSGGTKSSSNDITTMLRDIVSINNSLPATIPETANLDKAEKDAFNMLDIQYHTLVKGSTGAQVRITSTSGKKQPMSISSQIPKKEGIIRYNILGSRSHNMARTVITGDQGIRINQVGIPISIAKTLSIPEVVQPYNKSLMTMYFMNKNKVYPGCTKIIKASNGTQYNIENLDPEYKLQIGDTVLRNIIDGDPVCINRQPTLEWCSITSMKAVIIEDNSLTFRLNISACNLFNADFDGDEMNLILAQNIQSRNEISRISTPSEFFISYANRSPKMGAHMDALIGTAELTFDGVMFDKWHAMNMFSQIDTFQKPPRFINSTYTNREVVSIILPNITIIGKTPSFYKQQYEHIVHFNPKDIKVNIENGKLISGILDKATIGQGSNGSIFHRINNDYGAELALESIHNFTQISNQFLYYRGYTIGLGDVSISKTAAKKVKDRIEGMLAESQIITNKLFNRNLIAPVGMDLMDYYEQSQLNILTPADEFIFPVLEDIDYYKNNFSKLIFTGSKGKLSNYVSINAAIGSQTIGGQRPIKTYGNGRTSPYFARYDLSPRANGYIPMSIKEGISPDVMPFITASTRQELINNALITSVTGELNRICSMNLEGLIIDNLRKSVKGHNVVQPLYAETGVDPRKLEYVKFPTIMISDDIMIKQFKRTSIDFDEKFRNAKVEKALADEFEQLWEDRNLYREIRMTIENENLNTELISNSHAMPVNIARIIDDIGYKFTERKSVLDPMATISKVKHLCDNIDYVYFNDFQERVRMKIPEFIAEASTLMRIQIRTYLSNAYLLEHNIDDDLLDIIIAKIRLTFKRSLIDYGKCVGIIAAQCMCSPMTQSVLDSKHRTAGGGTVKTNALSRFKEIFGCLSTEKMSYPSLLIMLENDTKEEIATTIATQIEIVKLEKFVQSLHVFFEAYGKPIHPRFIHEKKMIDEFEKFNAGMRPPSDLANWCIRFELNKETMVVNNMPLSTILLALRKEYPLIYIISTPETSMKIILRCYVRSVMIKQNLDMELYIIDLAKQIEETIIKGINGIHSAQSSRIAKSFINNEGAIETKQIYAIETYGTNLEEVLYIEGVDKYCTQSDSIMEFYEMFGIEATRNKIIYELTKAAASFNISHEHASVFADEMTYLSVPTGIQKTGMQAREMANISLRMCFRSPVQVIESAALNSLIDRVCGISGALVGGNRPNIGTSFNSILINREFIEEQNNVNDDEI